MPPSRTNLRFPWRFEKSGFHCILQVDPVVVAQYCCLPRCFHPITSIFGYPKNSLMYNFCPSLLNNNRGTISCNFVMINLQSSAVIRIDHQLISSFELGNNWSISLSKNEYLFNQWYLGVNCSGNTQQRVSGGKSFVEGYLCRSFFSASICVEVIKFILCCALSVCGRIFGHMFQWFALLQS